MRDIKIYCANMTFYNLKYIKSNCVISAGQLASLLSLYLSAKRSHHVRREGLEIPMLIQKREEYTPLDFMKI
jgi:hypothetical protein